MFQPITLSKLERMILLTSSKSCELNPIPTSLLKLILPSTIEIIADIINISFRDGIFLESLNEALVKLLLKKANLDLLDRNFRLVSSLGYVSKLTEHAAATQLVNHIEKVGVTSVTLNWLGPYLTDTTQAVVIGDLLLDGSMLASTPLTSEISQGSVLGPILFTLYMVPLGDLCSKNGIEFHLYADDTNLCNIQTKCTNC